MRALSKFAVDMRERHQKERGGERAMFHPQAPRPLTELQARYLQMIRESIELTGAAPTLSVLAKQFGVTHQSAGKVLEALAKKGFIEIDGHDTRTIKLTGKPNV